MPQASLIIIIQIPHTSLYISAQIYQSLSYSNLLTDFNCHTYDHKRCHWEAFAGNLDK